MMQVLKERAVVLSDCKRAVQRACSLGSMAQMRRRPSAGPAGPIREESGRFRWMAGPTPYLIRHLPVSSFPELPEAVAKALNRRGCLIPQTYQAHRPENVVAGQSGAGGIFGLGGVVLGGGDGFAAGVFWQRGERRWWRRTGAVLASAVETERLQAHGPDGMLGFNWGIDPATPERVHEAQAGMEQTAGAGGSRCAGGHAGRSAHGLPFLRAGAWIALAMPD